MPATAASWTTAQHLAFHGETPSLVVSEAQSSRAAHRPEDSIFLEQIVNDRLLVSIDPAREQQQEEGERGRHRGHEGKSA